MAVIHILKDGSRPKDITGHIVRMSDAESLYNRMKNMRRESKTVIHKNEVRV